MTAPRPRILLPALILLIAVPATASGEGLPVAKLERDTQVDFASEVVPFLRKNCFACHNEQKAKGDLNLEYIAYGAIFRGST